MASDALDTAAKPRRMCVVGTIGCGKTTCAREISERLRIQHIELDALHWEANWVEAPTRVFRERVVNAVQSGGWVVDGNYHQVRDILWGQADTVVWLDYSFRIIMSRLFRRTLRRVFSREELWKGNQERLRSLFTSDSVFWWAFKTYRKRRKEYSRALSQPENSRLAVIRLRSPKETSQWLSTLG